MAHLHHSLPYEYYPYEPMYTFLLPRFPCLFRVMSCRDLSPSPRSLLSPLLRSFLVLLSENIVKAVCDESTPSIFVISSFPPKIFAGKGWSLTCVSWLFYPSLARLNAHFILAREGGSPRGEFSPGFGRAAKDCRAINHVFIFPEQTARGRPFFHWIKISPAQSIDDYLEERKYKNRV